MVYEKVLKIFLLSLILIVKLNYIQAQELKDKNSTICKSVNEKLNTFGDSPLARELSLLLIDASKKGCGTIINKIFKNEDIVVDSRDRFANTPFFYASSSGHFEILKFLQSKGANINHLNLRGKTALLEAIKNNRLKIVKYLLKEGADPNTKTLDNETPLSAAAFNGNQIVVKALLKNKADPGLIDGTGKSAIIYAAAKGFSNIVKALLESGVDVNKKYMNDLTVLMWASGHTDDTPSSEGIKTIKIVVDKGADLNSQDNLGKTALMYSVLLNNIKATQFLLKNGADQEIKDNEGLKAIDLTSDENLLSILK